MSRILVTGAFGQIGTELTKALREKHGEHNVVASGLRLPSACNGPTAITDVTDRQQVDDVVRDYEIQCVYHLAAKLSAVGELDPQGAWEVNMDGLVNVLEVARKRNVKQVFWPSSIAAFGPDTPRDQTPQDTVMRPTTIYGVAKVAGELLGDYYYKKFGLDVRGIRFPGVISSETLPGGGTTDYAVDIFYQAVQTGRYSCFVRADTVLPMIYIPDCIKAILSLMEADVSRLRHHCGFNVSAVSFSAGELAAEIKKRMPDFECTFEPDERQLIADSWPNSLDDSAARAEWGWQPDYDLPRLTDDMLDKLRERQRQGQLPALS